MDSQPSRHVVLEDTPSDIVTPPVIPVQMPATQTLPTVSHDHVVVIPPMVTPVTVIEDPCSRMDRLERRIRQMRDLDEMISWDDPGDVPVATLPVGTVAHFVPIVIERRDTEMVRFIRVISSENLGGLSTGVSETVFLQREKAAEMIERPIERDQMSMFLRSLHPRFARHLTGVPFQDFRSLVQALFDVDDGISRGLWSDIIPSPDTEGKELTSRSDFPPLQHRHPHSVQQYPSVHPHIVTVRPSFHFQRPRLVSHGMSSLVPISDVRGLILIWGCLWIELLSDSDLLMVGHRTDYCASLRHTIQDLIDSGAIVSRVVPCVSRIDLIVLLFTRCTLNSLSDIVVFLEHIEIRLLQLRFTMSDEITPMTLTTLYEMMVDLTRRVERIELILSGHPSSSRGAPGVAMPSLPHLTSSTPATLGASHPRSRPHPVFQQHSSSISLATPTRPPPQFRGPPVVTVPQDRFPPHRRCRRHFSDLSAPLSRVFEMFHAMGFLAPLAPRALPDPMPHSFVLIYIDIVDSGTFGHPQSDMSLISTPAQAMHADVECEEFEPRVDLAWRGLAYDIWVAYDMRIGRLLDETVTYLARVDVVIPDGR
ncbi:hypothetical protein CK203_080078 [Vitis vinifera]|uniref:Uncharacterized protein n=1 Tax=Vitis vinifera TaxID=29760 RepID=A0A438D9U5_VITVI|nr:hypothetical protein CK203_080078 [Vitis vinifera]